MRLGIAGLGEQHQNSSPGPEATAALPGTTGAVETVSRAVALKQPTPSRLALPFVLGHLNRFKRGGREHGRGRRKGCALRTRRSGALLSSPSEPGKLEIQATKPLGNQRDLALAYSPGVARSVPRAFTTIPISRRTTQRAQSRRRRVERVGRPGTGQYRSSRLEARDGGKAVLFKKFAASTCSTSRSTRRKSTRWSRPSPHLNPRSAGSISRTSRRRNASRWRSG